LQKLAATALWQGAKLEEVPEVSGHPRELLNKVMVAVDRAMQRRDTPDGRKLTVLDLHSKVSTLIWSFRPCRCALQHVCCCAVVVLLLSLLCGSLSLYTSSTAFINLPNGFVVSVFLLAGG
jgi:hypothetical protein